MSRCVSSCAQHMKLQRLHVDITDNENNATTNTFISENFTSLFEKGEKIICLGCIKLTTHNLDKKKYLLWVILLVKTYKLRHNLDVMHIKKYICVNIVGISLDRRKIQGYY